MRKDDGGDLVETSILIMELLCARQYFRGRTPRETKLRELINALWHGMEWDWYTPRGLKDRYADYWEQNLHHVRINRAHCAINLQPLARPVLRHLGRGNGTPLLPAAGGGGGARGRCRLAATMRRAAAGACLPCRGAGYFAHA